MPIGCVRRNPQLSKDKYYRNFVLEFLRSEHSHAANSLATVLKNGRIVVRIKDLKEKFPMSAEFLYKFSKEHPEVLRKYKLRLKKTAINERISRLKTKPKVLNLDERISYLKKIETGKSSANEFHKISYDNLIYLFGNRVSKPNSETKINNGRKRIDITFTNNNQGFFRKLNEVNHIFCPKIMIECKNYTSEISNPEIDQLQGRLNNKRGMFGILFCRSINNKKDLLNRCKDVMNDGKGYIVVLDDNDIIILLNFKENGDEISIDNYLDDKLDELIM